MSIQYKVVKQVFGFDKTGAQKYVARVVAQTIYRRKINFVPGKMLKDFLRDAPVSRMAIPNVDYTEGGSQGGKFQWRR